MRVVASKISNIIVCKRSSSSSIMYENERWSPIPFSVSLEGVKNLPVWTLLVETEDGLQAVAQDSCMLMEGVQWVFVCLSGCVMRVECCVVC